MGSVERFGRSKGGSERRRCAGGGDMQRCGCAWGARSDAGAHAEARTTAGARLPGPHRTHSAWPSMTLVDRVRVCPADCADLRTGAGMVFAFGGGGGAGIWSIPPYTTI